MKIFSGPEGVVLIVPGYPKPHVRVALDPKKLQVKKDDGIWVAICESLEAVAQGGCSRRVAVHRLCLTLELQFEDLLIDASADEIIDKILKSKGRYYKLEEHLKSRGWSLLRTVREV